MKTYIFVILLLTVFQGFGQKKKKADAKDLKIDSLTRANSYLSVQLDSVSRDRKLYYGVYTTIKEKVLLKDFDPAGLPQIIDSIRASRDSAASLLAVPIAGLTDSLSIMTKENEELRAKVDSMTVTINTNAVRNADKTKLVAELKELKGLLDSKLINQVEYDAKKKLVMEKWQ